MNARGGIILHVLTLKELFEEYLNLSCFFHLVECTVHGRWNFISMQCFELLAFDKLHSLAQSDQFSFSTYVLNREQYSSAHVLLKVCAKCILVTVVALSSMATLILMK